jgi:hypothetical protein
MDVLEAAWERVRANKGARRVDGQLSQKVFYDRGEERLNVFALLTNADTFRSLRCSLYGRRIASRSG